MPEIRVQQSGVTAFVKGVYNDPFKWSLVKSVALFALGIRISRECIGMALMGPVAL